MRRMLAVLAVSFLLITPAMAGSHFGLMTCLQWFLPTKAKTPARVGVSGAEKEKFITSLEAAFGQIFKDTSDRTARQAEILKVQHAFLHKFPSYFWPQYRHWLTKLWGQVLRGEKPRSWLELIDVHWQGPAIKGKGVSRLEEWQTLEVESFLGFYTQLYKTDASFEKNQVVRQAQQTYWAQGWPQKFFQAVDVAVLSETILARVVDRLNKYSAFAQTALATSGLSEEWCFDNLPQGLKLIYLAAKLPPEADKQRRMRLRRWVKQDLERILADAKTEDKAYYRILLGKVYANSFAEFLLEYIAQEFMRLNFISMAERPNEYLAQRTRLQALGALVVNPVYTSLIGSSMGAFFYERALQQAAWATLKAEPAEAEKATPEEVVRLIAAALDFKKGLGKDPRSMAPLAASELAQMHRFWQELAALLSPQVLHQYQWDVRHPLWRD
ncbi:MAG: hypothetical protein J6Y94_04640 [Bacteriovoracaceae bacterium]|nr:hypothetical protein [Bacteriovoracaceae bacterium]